MATLQKIRNRAGLLIAIIIGMALIAFVIDPSTISFIGAGDRFEIAEIGNNSVSYQDYLARVEELTDVYELNSQGAGLDQETQNFVRERVWQNVVEDMTLRKEYEKLGLDVSSRELFEIIQGDNPHPLVRQIFTNPETGQVNRAQLLNFWKSLSESGSPEQLTMARFIETSILRERLMTKYNNLVRQGLYVTDIQARNNYIENNRRVDFDYVVQRFNAIPDSAVDITSKDLRDYYKEHQNQYQQEKSIDLEYVVFDIEPTEGDKQVILNDIKGLKDEFTAIPKDEVELFVRSTSDESYSDENLGYDDLSPSIKDSMFNAEPGYVYGPYQEDDAYKMTRLVEINYVPDSVRARHILIQPSQQMDMAQAQTLADSLKNLIEGGANFETLAQQYSQDPGSASEGGNLGWFTEGTMVEAFNDAAFENEVGEIEIVETNYGLHIIQVLERGPEVKKIKVATVVRYLEPSEETINEIYRQASQFGGNNRTYQAFNEAVKKQGYNKRIASNLKPMDRTISGLETPREMIQWGFNAEEGDVSDIFEIDEKFVVATVKEKREKGVAPFEKVEAEVRLAVLKEKKGKKIAGNIKNEGKERLSELAVSLDTEIKTATNITFSSFSIPEAGVEPKVIAKAVYKNEGEISEPIIGSNGVYVIEVTNVDEPEMDEMAIEQEKERLSRSFQSRANFEPVNAIKEKAEIEDKRWKFF